MLGAEFDDVAIEPDADARRYLLLGDAAEVRQEVVALACPA